MSKPVLTRKIHCWEGSYALRFYGWANVAQHGRTTKQSGQLYLRANPERPLFECGTACAKIAEQLSQRGLQPEVLSIDIPYQDQTAPTWKHCLVAVPVGAAYYLIGFTPFDKILGINPYKELDHAAYQEFCTHYNAQIVNPEEENRDQIITINGKNYYPFTARFENGQLALTEVFGSGTISFKLTLRGSLLALGQEPQRLRELGAVSYHVSFRSLWLPDWLRGPRHIARPTMGDELDRQPKKWGRSGPAAFSNAPAPNWQLLQSVISDAWPALGKLIEVASVI